MTTWPLQHKRHYLLLPSVPILVATFQVFWLILVTLTRYRGNSCVCKAIEGRNRNNGNNSFVDRSATKTVSSHLPRRLLTVFGLESSGTTFVTQLLERSTGVKHSVQKTFQSYQVQHVSLPTGMTCSGEIHVVPVQYPTICNPSSGEHSTLSKNIATSRIQCPNGLNVSGNLEYPSRYFVNITSHVQWYRQRGVDVTAVLVIRDKTIGSVARSLQHCTIPEFQREEETLGMRIMNEAMDSLGMPSASPSDSAILPLPPPLFVLSYETLSHMRASYLNFVLRQLQLPLIHDSLEWLFEDGNARYVRNREDILLRIPKRNVGLLNKSIHHKIVDDDDAERSTINKINSDQ